jgi:SNF2 family DNA or RNA helicase
MKDKVVTAEHVASLREIAGEGIPDATLRKILVRSAGNLNRAAELVLLEKRQSTPEKSRPAPGIGQNPASAEAAAAHAVTSLPSDVAPLHPPPLPANVRKRAWKRFWKNHYEKVCEELGPGRRKEDINVRISNLWRDLGADARDALYVVARDELQISLSASKAETATSAIARDSALKVRRAEDAVESSRKDPKVSRRNDAPDVSDGRRREERLGVNERAVGEATEAPASGLRDPKTAAGVAMAPDFTVPMADVANDDDVVDIDAIAGNGVDINDGEALICAFTKGDSKQDLAWPRRVATRILLCTMSVSGNVVRAGHSVSLSPSNGTIVRFAYKGREIGRLPSATARFLAPALASGFVHTTARVVEAPRVSRPLSDIYIEVSIFVRRTLFQALSSLDLPAVEKSDISKGRRFKHKSLKPSQGSNKKQKNRHEDEEEFEGIDVGRLSVESLLLHLGVCDPPTGGSGSTAADSNCAAGASGAEAYFDAVHQIDCKIGDEYEHPKPLLCSLRDYQKIGVMWMRSRELHGNSIGDVDNPGDVDKAGVPDACLHPLWRRRQFSDGEAFFSNGTTGGFCLDPVLTSTSGPRGGLLADEMGLGKTIQTLAVIVLDRSALDSALTAAGTLDMDKHSIDAVVMLEDEEGRKGDEVADSVAVDFESRDRRDGKDDEADVQHLDEPAVVVACEDEEDSEIELAGKEGCSDSNGDDDNSSAVDENRDSSDSDFVPDLRVARAHVSKQKAERNRERRDISWIKKAQFARHNDSSYSRLHSRRAREKTGKRKNMLQGGTLLVVPMSMIAQWKSELEKHVERGFLRCKTHHEQRGGAAGVSVQYADVVLTTYGVLQSELGNDKKAAGPLYLVEWRRVVLDEAHSIKGRVTKSAKACFQLCAELKWCLTGSPIQNEVSDVQPLLRFLLVEPWSSWGFWQRGLLSKLESTDAKVKAEGYAALRSILSPLTLRRLKSTVGSDGKPLVQLMERSEETVRLTAGEAELAFYDSLFSKSAAKFSGYVASGKVLNMWANVLELLLRLRQACCHPWLVFAASQADAKASNDRAAMYEQFAAGGSATFAEHAVTAAGEECGVERSCPICLSDVEDATAVKRCGHAACRDCLLRMLATSSNSGHSSACPVCRASITGKADLVRLPQPDGSRFPLDIHKHWRSSTKLDFIIAEVQRMEAARRAAPDGRVGKTVVMSQFTSFLDLIGAALEREDVGYLRFDGSLNARQRATVLGAFADDDEAAAGTAQVLIVSLRSGNVGLNLVSASLCVLADPSWNPMVDAQAAARIHRHGQRRKVRILRLVVKGTVEERLLQVQDAKKDMTEGALAVASREDRAVRIERMKMLFAR